MKSFNTLLNADILDHNMANALGNLKGPILSLKKLR